jgi:hypothetical protein
MFRAFLPSRIVATSLRFNPQRWSSTAMQALVIDHDLKTLSVHVNNMRFKAFETGLIDLRKKLNKGTSSLTLNQMNAFKLLLHMWGRHEHSPEEVVGLLNALGEFGLSAADLEQRRLIHPIADRLLILENKPLYILPSLLTSFYGLNYNFNTIYLDPERMHDFFEFLQILSPDSECSAQDYMEILEGLSRFDMKWLKLPEEAKNDFFFRLKSFENEFSKQNLMDIVYFFGRMDVKVNSFRIDDPSYVLFEIAIKALQGIDKTTPLEEVKSNYQLPLKPFITFKYRLLVY